jgi:hypothetical protein
MSIHSMSACSTSTGLTSSPGQLRSHAAHLLGMAIKARQDGDYRFADRLAVEAAEYIDEADDAEKPIAQHRSR